MKDSLKFSWYRQTGIISNKLIHNIVSRDFRIKDMMMGILCRKCGSGRCVKNGVQSGIQRYKCNDCKLTFRTFQPKYNAEMKLEALKMYKNP